MSLNKKKMVREIGLRTRLKNCDVQAVLETLVEIWTEELASGGRIELEHFIVLKTLPSGRVRLSVAQKLRDEIKSNRFED